MGRHLVLIDQRMSLNAVLVKHLFSNVPQLRVSKQLVAAFVAYFVVAFAKQISRMNPTRHRLSRIASDTIEYSVG